MKANKTWHNAASRFILRQDEFTKPGAWSGAEKTQIVGNLHQTARDRIESSAHLDESVVRRQSLELVGCRHKRQFYSIQQHKQLKLFHPIK